MATDRARNSQWRKNNREYRNAYMRAWWKKNPEKSRLLQRKASYKRKYGITLDDYDRLLAKQDGHCAICKNTPEVERYKRLNVDHCHNTGRVRGLLCTNCNHALGRFGDTADDFRRVLRYLEAGT